MHINNKLFDIDLIFFLPLQLNPLFSLSNDSDSAINSSTPPAPVKHLPVVSHSHGRGDLKNKKLQASPMIIKGKGKKKELSG